MTAGLLLNNRLVLIRAYRVVTVVRTASHDRVDQHGEGRHEINERGHGDGKLTLQVGDSSQYSSELWIPSRGTLRNTGAAFGTLRSARFDLHLPYQGAVATQCAVPNHLGLNTLRQIAPSQSAQTVDAASVV